MAPSGAFQQSRRRKLIGALCSAFLLVALWHRPCQAVTVQAGPAAASGGSFPRTQESVVYTVGLGSPNQELLSIAVQIDGSGFKPILAADIIALTLYVDANGNGVWEQGTDTQIVQQPAVNVGGVTTLTDPTPSETIPPVPAALWFFVTIRFNESAEGKSLTAGAPANNITAQGPPPVNLIADGSIAQGAPVLVAGIAGTGRPLEFWEPIPVGGEWIAGLAFLGYGAYWLLRRRKSV